MTVVSTHWSLPRIWTPKAMSFKNYAKKIPFQLLSKLYHALIKVTFWKFAWNRLHTLHLITACPDTFKLINNMRIFKEESCLALLLSHQRWQHPVLCPLILSLASGKSLLHQKTQSKNLSLSTIQHACLFTELLNLLKILFFFFFPAYLQTVFDRITGTMSKLCFSMKQSWTATVSLIQIPMSQNCWIWQVCSYTCLQLFYDRLGNKLAFIQLKGFMSKAV